MEGILTLSRYMKIFPVGSKPQFRKLLIDLFKIMFSRITGREYDSDKCLRNVTSEPAIPNNFKQNSETAKVLAEQSNICDQMKIRQNFPKIWQGSRIGHYT